MREGKLKSMKVYLSGSIKNDPNYVAKFELWEQWLINAGHEVINPVTVDHAPDASYGDFMRNDIKAMLDCESIAMIPGWETSQGAKLEFLVATMCDMEVLYL